MLNIFDEAAATMRRAVQEQTNQLLSEIKSANDQLNSAQVEFDQEINAILKDYSTLEGGIIKERAALDDKERRNKLQLQQREKAARDKLLDVMSDARAVLHAVHIQINAGVMYTGFDAGEKDNSAKYPTAAVERRDSMPLQPLAKKEGDQ